jgi:hypothetical protein
MDDCIAKLGVTYVGGGRRCTSRAAHHREGAVHPLVNPNPRGAGTFS